MKALFYLLYFYTICPFVVCRAMGDVSDRIGRPTDNGQVATPRSMFSLVNFTTMKLI